MTPEASRAVDEAVAKFHGLPVEPAPPHSQEDGER